MLRSTIVAVLAVISLSAHAQSTPFDACFEEAAQYQGLPASLLKAIAQQESSMNPRAVSRPNSNGTRDIGLMQINSWWIPRLKKMGLNETDLFDPCVSIHVGAWILAQEVATAGLNWKSIGAYNAGPQGAPAIRMRYTQEVLEKWKRFSRPSQLAAR